ncbi:peroxiredoxin-like family protein [Subtercola lobariae]|uniref:thioredoxin-dependent peroxiredoxin n=1 Tax=Subtercola lobariae TaxID=1588641 RepID=A0A917BDD8_9MICO|nr:peroxiredoxin-like family protein [Subtercola lobariae]GGF34411.1 peroxiredoxin [Subtercola lobariae]
MAQTSPTIAEQVAVLRASSTPSPTADKFTAEQQALSLQPTPEGLLPVGSAFPDGDLLDAQGDTTSLGAVLGGAPAVVIFYRGAWCPYCNIALRTYRDQLASPLADLGVTLVALSPQKADGSLTMKEKNELEFLVLSDPGNGIASALGILTHPSDGAREAQLERGLDLETMNADETTNVPMPTVALIDADGTLVWIDVHPDYTTRTESAEILAAVHENLLIGKVADTNS